MRILVLFALLFSVTSFAADAHPPTRPTPVLVELFTSEGCSSCPPADALLQQLDTQPIPGVQLIVLSEHVDYWNHIGWKDPYSSPFFSQRQNTYAQRTGSGSVYTPQMIVDGTTGFVGSDSREAQKVIEKSRDEEKLPVTLSNPTLSNGTVRAKIDIAQLSDSLHVRSADVYVAVALNHAESQVLHGENEGRRLQHVAVVKSVIKIGSVNKTQSFSQEASVKIEGNPDPANVRLIVFAQNPGTGRVLGAALNQLKP